MKQVDGIMKRYLLGILAVCFLFLSACGKVIDLTEEEEDIIAEYAADKLVYQYKVSKGMIELEPETMESESASVEDVQPEETTTAQQEEAETIPQIVQNDDTDQETVPEGETDPENTPDIQTSSNTGSDVGMAALMEALQVSGVELSVLGYSIVDRYPTEAYALSVEAEEGHKLLVVEYDVWNSEDTDAVMEIHTENASIKAIINGTDTENPITTLLKSDLQNMNGTQFAPGEAKVGVLIFHISDEEAADVTSVQVKAAAK